MLANQVRKEGGVGVGTPGETLSQENKAGVAKAGRSISLYGLHTHGYAQIAPQMQTSHTYTYITHTTSKQSKVKQADGKGWTLA